MATPAQISANSTGWSLKKLATISVRTPSQSPRRVTSARRVFYHMAPVERRFPGSGGRFVGAGRPGELRRRPGADELGMDDADVQGGRLGGRPPLLRREEGGATAAE